jgi:hypothetical protein
VFAGQIACETAIDRQFAIAVVDKGRSGELHFAVLEGDTADADEADADAAFAFLTGAVSVSGPF